jgi:hypothetical protein
MLIPGGAAQQGRPVRKFRFGVRPAFQAARRLLKYAGSVRVQPVASIFRRKFVFFNGELGFVNHLARNVTGELTKRSKLVLQDPAKMAA